MVKIILKTSDLTKIYPLKGKTTQIVKALDNVNLDLRENEILGLLGPNGAGKTTLVQILTSLKYPTSGYATINGYDILKKPKKARENIGLMLGNSMLYYRITGYANLKFFCKIYKVPYSKEKIDNLAREFGLNKWLDQYVEKYSAGMAMKLAFIRTLLVNRPIFFLDEPTSGLDVESKSIIVKKIKGLAENHSILFTSHDMGVVEKVCDRIAFINKGKIIKIGTKEDIKKIDNLEPTIRISINEDKTLLKEELNQHSFVSNLLDNGDEITIRIKDRTYYSNLLSILVKYNVSRIQEIEEDLASIFLKIVK